MTIVMDRAAIERAIPHRAPYLFVDRVLERTDDAVTAEWDITSGLEALSGHYPGRPVVPGALISEFTFQCAAILFAVPGRDVLGATSIPVLTKIEDARFKKMVAPGETLRAHVETVERLGNARFMKALVTSSGETVARLRFTVALVE
jgi:3-hydroxyacyl-[acyl-carrier-protein] dehydratase